MALSLGDVTFGLGADTRQLLESLKLLRDFGKVVDATAASQSKGASAAAAAMVRQEQAIRNAAQQTLNLIQRLRELEAAPVHVERTARAFHSLSQSMTTGRISTVEFTRAQDQFRAAVGRTNREIRNLRAARSTRFTEFVRDLESASVLAVGPLSGLGARIRALGAITSRSTLAIAGFLGGITAVTVGVVKLGQAAITAARSQEQLEAKFTAGTGSIIAARDEIEFTLQVAKDLKLEFTSVAEGYASLAAAARGTKIEGEGTRKVFLGVSAASRALRLDTQTTSGILRALQQVMSKGVAQAEEIRGQFGERLPGGFQIAAAAMGVTTEAFSEMLRKGEVIAEDFLPKLGEELESRFGTQARLASDDLTGSINLLSTSMFGFGRAIDQAVGASGLYSNLIQTTTSVVQTLTENIDVMVGVFGAATFAITALFAPHILAGFTALIGAVKTLTVSVLALDAALTLSGLGKLIVNLAKLGAVVLAAAVGYNVFTAALEESKEANDAYLASLDQFIEAEKELRTASGQTTDAIIRNTKARITAVTSELNAEKALLESKIFRTLELMEPRTFFGIPMSPTSEEQAKAMTGIQHETDRVVMLTNTLKELQDRMKELQDIAATPVDLATGGVVGEISTEGEKALDNLKDMIREFQGLQAQQASIELGLDAVKSAEAFGEAIEVMRDVPVEELHLLRNALEEAGFSGDSLVTMIESLVLQTNSLSETVKDATSALEAQDEVLKETTLTLQDMRMEATALEGGIQTFREFERQFERTKAIEAFKQELVEARVNQEELNRRVGEFTLLFDRIEEGKRQVDDMRQFVDGIGKAFDRAFDRIGESITDAFVRGEEAVIAFGNVANAILAEIFQTILEITLLAPIKNAIAGPGGFLESFFSPLPTGPGPGAGPPIRAAKGMVLPGRSMIMAGEAGNEGLFPLRRTSSGRLGVEGSTPDVDISVVIVNNANAQVATEKRRTAAGTPELVITIDQLASKALNQGGELFNTIQTLFDVNTRIGGR